MVTAAVILCARGFRVSPKKTRGEDVEVSSSFADVASNETDNWLGLKHLKAIKANKAMGLAGGEKCAARWGQCGGNKFKGPTCCVAGTYCKVQNSLYSQCRKAIDGQASAGQGAGPSPALPILRTMNSPTGAISGNVSEEALKRLSGNLGSGKTTRYWDCCKPSCSWGGKAQVSSPVKTCQNNGITKDAGANTKSVCDGGSSYMCNGQQPWYDPTTNLNYGFAATHIAGGSESSWCCACYDIRAAGGKRMIVQVTNTGGDLGSNHFDIQIPGGGFGIFDGCSKQWGAKESTWGARYGGVMAAGKKCDGMPGPLKTACNWQFTHWGDNPAIQSFYRVQCPAAILAKSNCKRNDE